MNPKERLVLLFLTMSLFVGLVISLYHKYRTRKEMQAIAIEFSRPETTFTPVMRLVNINQAAIEDLDRLPGIGPALAQRIIDFRTKQGMFKKKEDIMRISGIGKKKFEALKDKISVENGGGEPRGQNPLH